MLSFIFKENKPKLKKEFIFRSERLGFRNWLQKDLNAFAKLNADATVMEHFPKALTKEETAESIKRFQDHYDKFGYTYYATEVLETGEFIGFIGLSFQDYESNFNPAVDIGWRIKKSAWGNGYATEGAKRCLEFAFNDLKLESVVSVCTIGNSKSERIMKKIGMVKKGTFDHPKLKAYPEYEKCMWYEINKKA